MNTTSVQSSLDKPRPVAAILVGGFIAGAFDLTLAYISYGWNMPRGIARGLVGSIAFQGGAFYYVLGIALHFFIALSAATVYYGASLKLKFLKEYPFVCGLFYGIAIFLVMNLIVLPLSAIHFKGPFRMRGLDQGLLVHMFLIGLPIAYSVRIFSKNKQLSRTEN
ncbi:MAG TPA: hypothetical protein VGG46_12085 [Terriglobales bacterium]|jgi:hypothetical protein